MNMKKKFVIILIVILSLALISCLVYFVVRQSGKNKLTQNDKIPSLPPNEENSVVVDEAEYSVKYNGKKYAYNKNMINVLFIGIDTDKKSEETLYGNGGQSDVLLLSCINPDTDEVKIISIPRDTISNVVVYDYKGEAVDTQRLPISLSHAYGDGGVKSAELTVNSVSDLLYGLPIHAWFSFNVDAIKIINDAVGGVPIVADENNIALMPPGGEIGKESILLDRYAKRFVINRENSTDSERRIRQKQYLSSFVKQAKKAFVKNPFIVVDVYKRLNDYSLTSLTMDEIVWLAGEVSDMEISMDFTALKGKEIQGETMTEFHVDDAMLYETMLDIFYIEVE